MKSALIFNPLAGALAILGALATPAVALAGTSQSPVCTPAREVGSVLGRGAPVAAQVQCLVERKVRPALAGDHVAVVLGRAGAAPRQSEATTSVVSIRISGSKAVETVLGRAGGGARTTDLKVETVATPSQ